MTAGSVVSRCSQPPQVAEGGRVEGVEPNETTTGIDVDVLDVAHAAPLPDRISSWGERPSNQPPL